MITSQMRGGTNSSNVPAEAFSMPAGLRVRYDEPAPELNEYLTGYAIYAADDTAMMTNWYLPAPAMISVLVDAGPVNVSIRSRQFGPLERVSLYGPTSRAIRTQTTGGIAVGIGISALGWSRLTKVSAGDFHNRIVPLSTVLDHAFSDKLVSGLDAMMDDTEIKTFLDAVLAPIFLKELPEDWLIRKLTELTVTADIMETLDISKILDMKPHSLRRFSARYFGMTPKLILRRTRFLRSFTKLMTINGLSPYSNLGSDYFDASHFLRDAGTFLGTTPQRFLNSETTFLRTSLRVRGAVLGASTQALQHSFTRKAAP